MNISEKDKKLLAVFLIVLICFGYYEFGFTTMRKKISELNQKKEETIQKYDSAMLLVNSLPKKQSELKIMKVKIDDHLAAFYPAISQEKIILELDKLLNDSKLTGNISFSPVSVQTVEAVQDKTANKAESSLKPTRDKYEKEFNVKREDSSNNSKKQGSQAAPSEKSTATTEQLKITVTFTGIYGALKSFLAAVDKNDKRIVVNKISVTQQTAEGISGTMNLEMYAVPKPADKDTEYLIWKLKNTYGKDSPFSSSAAVGSLATIEQIMEPKDTNDFVISVKSSNSDLPNIMMGKANDTSRLSYAYADSNKEENAEMVISEVDDKYYVKYKTSTSSYPAQYSGSGSEFIPVSKDLINIKILSEARTGDNDKSSLNLKITNNTKKLVKVQVNNEDKNSPRVKVASSGSLVNVEQK